MFPGKSRLVYFLNQRKYLKPYAQCKMLKHEPFPGIQVLLIPKTKVYFFAVGGSIFIFKQDVTLYKKNPKFPGFRGIPWTLFGLLYAK